MKDRVGDTYEENKKSNLNLYSQKLIAAIDSYTVALVFWVF